MLTETLDLTAEQFAEGTGWEIKPQGACKAEVCVPLGSASGDFDVRATSERLGMSIVNDESTTMFAIGPESVGDRALATAQAPELVLEDLDGNEFRLSSRRGQKVVIVSRAPY
jgi:hypothetical protein